MSREPVTEADRRLTGEERIAAIAELLVIGAIAAVGLSEGRKDRGHSGHDSREGEDPQKPRRH